MTTANSTESRQVTRAEAIAFAVAEIDQTGPEMFHTSLAPRTAAEYLSSEATSVVITKDLGRWWIKVESQVGSSDYSTLDEAKIAAAELVVESQETMDADIVRSLEIDTDEWDVVLDNGSIILKPKDDAREIVGSNVTETWSLYDGNGLISENENLAIVLSGQSARTSQPGPRL
jgi:hypothetical protein|nr:hypothetical protein [Neorhizobium tomejilense]